MFHFYPRRVPSNQVKLKNRLPFKQLDNKAQAACECNDIGQRALIIRACKMAPLVCATTWSETILSNTIALAALTLTIRPFQPLEAPPPYSPGTLTCALVLGKL
eukprot:jgi/Botrbrau1/4277/Bobra.0390s0017.1